MIKTTTTDYNQCILYRYANIYGLASFLSFICAFLYAFNREIKAQSLNRVFRTFTVPSHTLNKHQTSDFNVSSFSPQV